MNMLKQCLDGDTLLDNQDICELLCVTKRTLALYRQKKLISYLFCIFIEVDQMSNKNLIAMENIKRRRIKNSDVYRPKKELHKIQLFFAKKWSHLGLNQGPPDYESGALTS